MSTARQTAISGTLSAMVTVFLYHVDIDANKSAGQYIIYKSLTHPLPYDTSAYPAVGQVQEQTQTNGWQQENGKWYYYENGSNAALEL